MRSLLRRAECCPDKPYHAKGMCRHHYQQQPRVKAQQRKWWDKRWAEHRQAELDKTRRYKLRREFGIDESIYQSMLTAQNGTCAICGGTDKKRKLSIDHDHRTGRIRGLLCNRCNIALGRFHDDIAILHKAIIYLNRNMQ